MKSCPTIIGRKIVKKKKKKLTRKGRVGKLHVGSIDYAYLHKGQLLREVSEKNKKQNRQQCKELKQNNNSGQGTGGLPGLSTKFFEMECLHWP
ncbi:Uncharacterized protein TCM_000644 [Theobroma cacao]|uniref:Uncharacterized protein n=1 Tax=Theobroma cacao TaxID=3641 RepID=A0A061DH05_THECC|nr:Uncharacterized protein TCM_000644 [Theobroma cacao]